MAHFAKIENGIVTNVVVVDNSQEHRGSEFLNELGLNGDWVQTSYNANFGKKFAAMGDTYEASTGNFKPAKPYPSWTFDENTWSWISPKPFPTTGDGWTWDESLLDWVEI